MDAKATYYAGLVSGVAWAGALPVGPGGDMAALDAFLQDSKQHAYEVKRRANCLAQRAALVVTKRAARDLGDATAASADGDAGQLALAATYYCAHAAALAPSGLEEVGALAARARRLDDLSDSRDGKRVAASLAKVAVDAGEASPAFEAWAFELDLTLDAFDDAFRKTTTTAQGPTLKGPTSDDASAKGDGAGQTGVGCPERLPRLVRQLCDRGELGFLLAAPWSDAQRARVDDALEKLARRERVDDAFALDFRRSQAAVGSPFRRGVNFYKCLYAFRVKRGAVGDAARCALEVAARCETLRSPNGEAATLAAELMALNCLRLLDDDAAFVAARPVLARSRQPRSRAPLGGLSPKSPAEAQSLPRDDDDGLTLTGVDDLEARVFERAAKLKLGGDGLGQGHGPPRARDVALELARRGEHRAALRVASRLGVDVRNVVVSSLATACCALDRAPPASTDDVVRRDDASPFAEEAEQRRSPGDDLADDDASPRRARLLGAPVSSSFAAIKLRLLEDAIADQDAQTSNFSLAIHAAKAFLDNGEDVPPFLEDALRGVRNADRAAGDFARRRADPAKLVALYLSYGKLHRALAVASAVLAAPAPDLAAARPERGAVTFLPVALLDDLQDATEAAIHQGHTDLTPIYDTFKADLDAHLLAVVDMDAAAPSARALAAF